MTKSDFSYEHIRFSKKINHSNVGIALVNPETGNIIDVNNIVESIFGYSRDEVIQGSDTEIKDLFHKEDLKNLKKILLKDGFVNNHEINAKRKDQHTITLNISAEILEIDQSQYAFVMMTEISEKKLAQEKLYESEERFRSITESIQDVFWMSDIHQNKVYYLSPAFEKIWEISPEMVYNHPECTAEMVVSEDKQIYLNSINNQENGLEYNAEYRIKTPSGKIKYILDRGFPVYNNKNEFHRFSGVAKDITNEKLAQQRTLQINEELEKMVKLRTEELTNVNNRLNEEISTKDKFFSIIAHDLKNPFNSILVYSQMMQRNLENMDSQKLNKNLNGLIQSAENAYNLLENLLEWARSQTGRLLFQPEKIEIESLVNQTIESIATTAHHKQIIIENLPFPDTYVFADKNMTNTIIRNLLTNAIKYTHQGGLVLVSYKMNDVSAIISVTDTGVGMNTFQVENLFKIDKKVSMPGTDREQGTGLGLIVSKEFVQIQGGEITVKSEPQQGSTFTFSLPLWKE